MKPRGPLMVEHRLIEKMLDITEKELDSMARSGKADPCFIDLIVDFIRVYADKTHHGKEEDILFAALAKKKLSSQDSRVMKELIEEHKIAREAVKGLVEANRKYAQGDLSSSSIIIEKLRFLLDFYPPHIAKEDDIFFPDSEKYFSADELNKMLADFYKYDQTMIHEKYKSLYKTLQARY